MTERDEARAEPIRRRVRVHGRVQGVWFRRSTCDAAAEHGVQGWVRNREDGSVEAAFEGPAEGVEALLAFVGRGPPGARVDRVEVATEAPRGERGFRMKR
jgi:acylphosphatase